MIEHLKTKSVCISTTDGDGPEPQNCVEVSQEETDIDRAAISFESKFFLNSDLRLDVDVLGKVTNSMHYCLLRYSTFRALHTAPYFLFHFWTMEGSKERLEKLLTQALGKYNDHFHSC